jgi:hypothetical protein
METAAEGRRQLSRWLAVVLGVVWIMGLGVGLRMLLDYDFEPGAPGTPPSTWPMYSKVPHKAGLPTIVLVAHPQCPCTRATIGELALLMARLHNRVVATVVLIQPSGFAEKWAETDLWESAKEIPGVSVVIDPNGMEAARFGAQASGQTMLYDAEGRLEFSGGITAARGHSGDNAGRNAIVELVTTGTAERTTTSVFGCSLLNSSTTASTWKMP